MKSVADIIVRPLITEKSMNSGEKCYSFEVMKDATKPEIANAVEEMFGVKVAKVNVLNRKGKKKTFRGRAGETKATKIAIVRLSEGVINFEGGI